MHVFLDTNVFFNNWHLTNLNFKLLFHFLANESCNLLLSEVVVKEVNNKRDQQAIELLNELKTIAKKLNYLNSNTTQLPKNFTEIQPYDFRDVIGCMVEDIEDIPFDSIKHSEVVDRALQTIKPFATGEKGYRDTLIWLSFLEFLKVNSYNSNDKIAFVTENSNDFFQTKNKVTSFHPSLQDDIDKLNLKCEIVPFNSLHNFLTTTVDKLENSINKNEFLDENESLLIDETTLHIEGLEGEGLSNLLDVSNFHTKLPHIKAVQAEIFEGIECTDVYSVSELPDGLAYVDTFFEMSGLTFNIVIDINDYKANADYIENIPCLFNVELNTEKNLAVLGFYGKLSVESAVEYHLKTGKISKVTFNEVYFH